MDRQTIDQEGARTGQLFAHTLQLGPDTVTLKNIATMSIESETFQPWDTPRNRRVQRWILGTASLSVLVALVALVAWGITGGSVFTPAGLTGFLALGLFLALCVFATWRAAKMARRQPYFRLRIGASDGRIVSLVDDSRDMLEQLRDTIRTKIDTEDAATTGRFDLNRDTIDLDRPAVSEPVAP